MAYTVYNRYGSRKIERVVYGNKFIRSLLIMDMIINSLTSLRNGTPGIP